MKKGFTLLEVAIGLIILGLLTTPAIHLYRLYVIDKTRQQSDGHLIVIQSALQKFAIRNGRYPVPAAFNLGPGDTGFGREYTGTINNCTIGMDTVCRTTGHRNMVPPAGNDPVLVGTVPFAALGLPLRYARDGYLRKFTYAVTESLTATASFADGNGVIRILDRTGASAPDVADNAHYALVAHGADGKGAFNLNGTLNAPCTAALGADTINCSNSATFNTNFEYVGVAPDINYRRQEYTPAGALHYDDYVRYTTTTTRDTWTQTANLPDIYSRNSGNVRIGPGVGLPTIKVQVMGNVRANQLNTTRLCAYAGCDTPGSVTGLFAPAWPPNVFLPEILGGYPNPNNAGKAGGGINCGDKGMTGIANSSEICGFNSFSTGFTLGPTCAACASGLVCPTGTWARGTDASGHLVCVMP